MRIFIYFFFCLGWMNNSFGQTKHSIPELDSICQYYQKAEQFIKGKKYANLLVNKTKINKDSSYAKALLTLAHFQEKASEYNLAEANCHDALTVLEKTAGKQHLRYANTLELLGNIYYGSGRSQQAELQFLEAKNIYEKTVGKEHRAYSNLLGSLGGIYLVNGKLEAAEPLMLEGLKLTAKHYGKAHETYGLYLNNLAILYENLGKIAQARSMALEALAIRKKALGVTHLGYTHTLSEVARLYFRYGDAEKAEPLLMEVFETQKEIFGYKNRYTLNAINKLGVVNYYKKDYLAGLKYAKLSFYTNANHSIDTSSWEVLLEEITRVDYISFDLISRGFELTAHLFSRLYERTQDQKWEKCLFQLYWAQNRINRNVCNSFRSEQDKLQLTQQSVSLAEKGIEMALKLNCPACLSKAFLFAEENKSRLLAQALKTQQAQQFGDIPEILGDQEKVLQKRWSKIKKQLAEVAHKTEGKDALLSALNKVNATITQFQKKLEQNYPNYYKIKYNNALLSLKGVQKMLHPNQLLIEYFVTKEKIYIFSVGTNTLNVNTVPIARKDLTEKIAILRELLTNYKALDEAVATETDHYRAVSYWFYQNLLQPILEKEEHQYAKELILIPDGELGHLPFEAFVTKELTTPATSKYKDLPYLLNEYEVSYSYSASLWQENQRQPHSDYQGNLLAYAGSYDYKKQHNQMSNFLPPNLLKIRQTLMDLPAARQEVLALSELFVGTSKIEEAATEGNFKKDLINHDIIHLAMHGVLNQAHPILSALVFTETGDSLEDGFLQAYEISQMKMNAQLVVLSACETGFGQFKEGEGIMSLARSFMYAGVPSLVVSLWQVNDGSTSLIMQHFYKKLSEGMTKSKALQEAKLNYINQTVGLASHPTFWAPFIQLGDSRPIVLYKKGTEWIQRLLIGFGILALLIIGKIYLKKRNVA